MLQSKKKWSFNTQEGHEGQIVDKLLTAKGFTTSEARDKFLKPSLKDLNSAALLNQIDKAKDRIITAIENDEKIMIYGDYDADGMTSTALLMNVLIDLGANCDYFVPNRFTHGYGLNQDMIQFFHQDNVSLIITVDTGIANVDEVKFARKLGLDTIITDHHEPQAQIPEAIAVIHPKLSADYPFKELAGVGVAFQFSSYLLEDIPYELLPLVAIGTVADLVPLVDDNRILVYHGLKMFDDHLSIGLEHLLKSANKDIKEPTTETDIAFKIGPRLNAVGRLTDPRLAVELLLTIDPAEAEQFAGQIELLNQERKAIVTDIVADAQSKVNTQDGVIMLYDENWHEGVLGIAASHLVRTFDRPVIMLTHLKERNELKGSARSIPAFSLFENLEKINHLFTKFGGHSQAAGMTFPMDNFLKIKQALNDEIFMQLSEDDFKQEINHIETIQLNQLNEKLVYQVQELAPFGMQNEEPIFHIQANPSHKRQIGQDNKHLKIQFKTNDQIVDAVGFHLGHLEPLITAQNSMDVVGKIQINEWNGNRTPQILIEDLKIKSFQLFDFRAKAYKKYFQPFYEIFKDQVMVGLSEQYMTDLFSKETDLETVTYGKDLGKPRKIDILYITQLPSNLSDLTNIITHFQPQNVHLSFDVIDDAFMYQLPKREDFKWVYGYIMKKQPVHSKTQLNKILHIKKWRKEKLLFIIKVFYELQFIYVKNGNIFINENVERRPLDSSKTYQNHLNQGKIESLLYYSSVDDISEWFLQTLNENMPKEHISHGL